MTPNDKVLEATTKERVKFGRELRKEFLFNEQYRPFNHGSFGTYPRIVQKAFRSFQEQAEARPDQFIFYEYPKLLDQARESISKVLHAPVEELVFIPNATTGINTVLRSLTFSPGEHILYFTTIYGACERTIAYICETTPARPAKVAYTYPVEDDWLVEELRKKVKEVEANGGKVKIAIFDTVVSMPGVRMPFKRLTEACRELGVLSCIDGAHGVGHVEIDLKKLSPDFFVSNCHKWFHVPRGCAVFHVPVRNQHLIRSTLPTSHGYIPLPDSGFAQPPNPMAASQNPKSVFITNFEFVGTVDAGPYLCIPASIQWRESLGGENIIRNYCFTLAREGSQKVAEILGIEILDNSTNTLTQCCMANIRLPLDVGKVQGMGAKAGIEEQLIGEFIKSWMSKTLVNEFTTYMMIMFYNNRWWVRLSAQVYLDIADFEWAGETLKRVCERVNRGEWTNVGSKL